MVDVERWPEWTASINKVQRLDARRFGVDSQARISQPRFPILIWRVTQFEPGRGFIWETSSWGALTVAEHWITTNQNGGSTVMLKVRQTGMLVPILRPWISKITRRYMDMEAAGLKRRCETAA